MLDSVISGADYVKIATNYGNARERVLSSVQFLFDAVYDVVILNEISPSVDLLTEFYDSYNVNANILSSPITMLSAVRTLNNHVLNRGTDVSIDAFLDRENVRVTGSWALLSAAAGFPISAINIIP